MLRAHLWRELTALPAGERPKVGLVLSAGSIRGTAHVGTIAALEDAGFPVDVVAGTSMGAVFGALYAGGTSLRRLREIAESLRLTSGNDISTPHLIRLLLFDRLLSSENTTKMIDQELGNKRIEQLAKPFACVAMDLYSGEAIIFRDGPLGAAVRASTNLPGIFAPVEYRHRYLVDGGVVDYIPIDAARLLGADWVLASVTETDYTYSKPKNVFDSLEQVIDIRGSFLSREQRQNADFLIEPPVGDIGVYETDRIPDAIEKGVIAAKKRIKAAEESYILFSLKNLAQRWHTPMDAAR
jgi:NTE family protein